jgi:hypothetical protein
MYETDAENASVFVLLYTISVFYVLLDATQ